MRSVAWIGGVVLAGYAALLLLLFLFQSRLVYFPSRAIAATPAHFGMPYEEVELRASDGVRLQAWFIPAPERRGTILFFHGNAGNLSHRIDTIRLFRQIGYDTFILSYRGYGASDGTPGEEGTYRDAEAAWEHLTQLRGIPEQELVLFGRSLGAAVAAWLAARTEPRAVVLESTFTSVPDLGAEVYRWVPVRLLSRIRYPTLQRVGEIRSPLLIVHSEQDEIIPFRHGQALFEAARAPKEMLVIRGSHNDGFLTTAAYADRLGEFLSRPER